MVIANGRGQYSNCNTGKVKANIPGTSWSFLPGSVFHDHPEELRSSPPASVLASHACMALRFAIQAGCRSLQKIGSSVDILHFARPVELAPRKIPIGTRAETDQHCSLVA